MDEPFTGLDPVNLALLREAFLELRDEGRTIVFSTHQMEAAEALCESLAIVDRGRVVAAGTLGEIKRASRRADGPPRRRRARRLPAWLVDAARRPGRPTRRRLRRARAGGADRPVGDRRGGRRARRAGDPLRGRRPVARDHLHRARRAARPTRRHRPSPTTRRQPAACRSSRAPPDGPLGPAPAQRRRSSPGASTATGPASPLFLASTLVLMALALGVALAPIAIRYFDRRRSTRIAVVSQRRRPGARWPSASPTACSTSRPTAPTRRPGRSPSSVERATDAQHGRPAARQRRARRDHARRTGRRRPARRHATGPTARRDSVRSQLVGFAAVAMGILDWTVVAADRLPARPVP